MIDTNRKIIEALRTGVPTREVIELLSSGQVELETKFTTFLKQKKQGVKTSSNGFVFFGGFGTGKSHVLEAFSKKALDENFVVSRATISQNVKLGTPTDIIKSLLSQTQTLNHLEDGLERLLGDATATGNGFAPLITWVQNEVNSGQMSSIYLGIARGLANTRYGSDLFEQVIEFLRGSMVGGELKRTIGDGGLILPKPISRPRESAAFLTRLFVELGYAGWVVLFDELELIRLLNGHVLRGRSYAELAHWMGFNGERPDQGLTVIGCMTSGYVQERIDWTRSGPSEMTTIPTRILASQSSHLFDATQYGMELLQGWAAEPVFNLHHPTKHDLSRVQSVLKDTYEDTYQITVNTLPIAQSSIDPMRVHIRRWIVSWDLERQGLEIDLLDNHISQVYVIEEDSDTEDDPNAL